MPLSKRQFSICTVVSIHLSIFMKIFKSISLSFDALIVIEYKVLQLGFFILSRWVCQKLNISIDDVRVWCIPFWQERMSINTEVYLKKIIDLDLLIWRYLSISFVMKSRSWPL
jgi:hypothetical protein